MTKLLFFLERSVVLLMLPDFNYSIEDPEMAGCSRTFTPNVITKDQL